MSSPWNSEGTGPPVAGHLLTDQPTMPLDPDVDSGVLPVGDWRAEPAAAAAAEVPSLPPAAVARSSTGPPAMLVAVTAVLVAVAGVLVAVVMARGQHHSAAAEAPSKPASHTTAPASPPTTPAASASPTAGATTGTPSGRTQRYVAPGGLTVAGPSGWIATSSARQGQYVDYRQPGTASPQAGQFFHLGIGNVKPARTIAIEARAAANYLVTTRKAHIVSGPVTGTFVRNLSADIEYEYTVAGTRLQRHGFERIFIHGGKTLVVAASGPQAQTAEVRALFAQLLRSLHLS